MGEGGLRVRRGLKEAKGAEEGSESCGGVERWTKLELEWWGERGCRLRRAELVRE